VSGRDPDIFSARAFFHQALTFIFEPAAAAEPAAALAPAASWVAGFAAAGIARAPMICCSESNKLPRRFCVDPAGS
jgi:hypothetical protein